MYKTFSFTSDPPNVTISKVIDLHRRPLQLTCEIRSIPLSSIQWRKDEKIIENNEHFLIKKSRISIENEEYVTAVLTINVS
jgi:hypothetical protein